MILDKRPMAKVSPHLQQAARHLDESEAIAARILGARGVVPYEGPERRKWRGKRRGRGAWIVSALRWMAIRNWRDAVSFALTWVAFAGWVWVSVNPVSFRAFVLGLLS